MPHFLFEIGFEEMPARFLPGLMAEAETLFGALLSQAGIGFTGLSALAAPRRLAVSVPDMEAVTRREEEVLTGPPERAAFDAGGNPTAAAMGFARGHGLDVAKTFVVETEKGRYLAVRKTRGGVAASGLLPDICLEAVRRLSFPKKMRWGAGDFAFGRPIHWIVALLDEAVVPMTLAGVASGRSTRGHRVMGPGPFDLPTAGAYPDMLREKGGVILDPAERRKMIVAQAEALAEAAGGRAIISPALLDEVCGLSEHPRVIAGLFDPSFLAAPREVLLTSMETHQKSFGVEGSDGALLPMFLTTLGLEPENLDLVRRGWQRVLAARLSDAKFFWEADLKTDFETWLARLDKVVFLAGLGTMGEKARRLSTQCAWLADRLAPDMAADLKRAGLLAKCDLVSDMVGEFAELQGVMGGVYAREKGEGEVVARAVGQHYLPAGPDSPVPPSIEGALLSLADKADTLAGCFGMDLAPTGAADPYALRRAALGICRVLIEHGLRLPLPELLQTASDAYGQAAFKITRSHAISKLLDFFGQRLRAYLTGLGFETPVVDAALGAGFEDVYALVARVKALAEFAGRPDFAQAVLTFKRAANIIRKQGTEAGEALTGHPRTDLLVDDAEKRLAGVFAEVFPRFDELMARDDFPALLGLLYELRPHVDAFFDNVMVMCDDPELRLNRLNLLASLVSRLSRLADFAALQV